MSARSLLAFGAGATCGLVVSGGLVMGLAKLAELIRVQVESGENVQRPGPGRVGSHRQLRDAIEHADNVADALDKHLEFLSADLGMARSLAAKGVEVREDRGDVESCLQGVHDPSSSSVADTAEGIGAEGPTDSPSAPVSDTTIRDTLARLADLIGDDYTVSVTWGGAS